MKHNRHLVRYTIDNYANLAEGCRPLYTSLRSVSVSIRVKYSWTFMVLWIIFKTARHRTRPILEKNPVVG